MCSAYLGAGELCLQKEQSLDTVIFLNQLHLAAALLFRALFTLLCFQFSSM
jgi:hypothetical protein